MAVSKISPKSQSRTIFLFGDATDPWTDDLDNLYSQAASTPWLKLFLESMSNIITAEARAATMDRSLQDSLGHFSTLQELGQRYRHTPDQYGVAQALLLHVVRAGTLLLWAKQEPELIQSDSLTEWVGLSGGLLSLSALALSNDFESLYDTCLETTRLVFRVAKLASVKSRAMEEQPGTWGWAVLGISPSDLRNALERFQRTNGIVSKKAKVGVVGNGWSTVIGPPSVLKLFFTECSAVKSLAKSPLEIKAAQHALDITAADIEYMVGDDSVFLDRPLIHPNQKLWGMDDPAGTYTNWGDMLRDICSQVLSRTLDITEVMSRLESHLDGISFVRIIQPSTSSNSPYMASVLRTGGREVSVEDHNCLLPADDVKSLKPGRIAIVGMSGRGPGSDNVDEFWDLIMSKQDLCSEVPKDRFDIDEFYCPAHERGDKRCLMKVRYGCFMDNPGHFDSRFFHISPREAILMDPNHRQFLMSTYEALESAGYSDGNTRTVDPNRIAAFFGQATDDWHKQTHPTLGCDSYTLQGIQRAFGPGRLAWQFKWEGPTYALDSACAGTTSSIHLACLSLLEKDIDMAVAGAANILSWPHSFTCLDDSGILSPTGNCKTFRDDADGYCRGDFVGAVVLKRLEDAIAHNDNILAVVAASGRNHSGNSTSITTSDAAAQERLFRKVLTKAQVSPDDISYVECHGTGTQTGDPAEIGAIANTFKHRRRAKGPLPIGGIKANFGHSEAAAGLAELLKSIKMLQTDTIPPQAGMPHALNPKFPPLSEINIEIPSEPMPFKRESDKPRRILLNNFDAAGGNACLLLEEFISDRQEQRASDPRPSQVITISARTKAAYHSNKARLLEWLRANPNDRIEDIAYTTTARRMHHPFRFACTAASVKDLITKIDTPDTTASPSPSIQPTVFVFTGQGSHYAGMGAELYRTSPVFRETVDMCVSICNKAEFPEFVDIISDVSIDVSTKDSAQIQLAVITLELALTAFWRSNGIEPAMVIGHSLGEYAALHAAGVLSLTDTLYLVGSRAHMLLERCELGACSMLSVSASVATVRDCLAQLPSSSCAVACINSPSATVISGTTEDLNRFKAAIIAQDAKIRARDLSVPFAFHSFQVEPVLQDFTSLAAGVTYSPPRIPVASTLLGTIVDGPGIFNQDYLARQAREPVAFVDGLKAIKSSLDDPVYLEIGPGPVCLSFVRSTLSSPSAKLMHSIEANASNWVSISKSLSAAYMAGINVDWLAFHKPYEGSLQLSKLPAYAWDMKDYWVTYTDKDRVTKGNVSDVASHTIPPEPPLSTCAQYLVRKSSSPKIEVTFRAAISDPAFLALIDDHKMQQIGLCSGSVFCDAALTVAKYTLEYSGRKDVTTRSLTLHDPELLAPLTRTLVGVDGELHTTAVMDGPSVDTVQVSFKATSAHASHDLGSMRVQVRNPEKLQAEWDRIAYFIKTKMEDRIRSCKDGSGHRLKPEVLYALFAKNVEFGPAFKRIQEGYVARDYQDAAASIILDANPAGSYFTFSPYWGEALAHLAGFMVNGNPNSNPRTTFIVMGFSAVEQTVDFEPGKQYLTYTRISRWEGSTAYCDAYVFDADSSKLVMQCSDLRYQELPRVVWKNILEGGHTGSSTNSPAKVANKPVVKKIKLDDTAQVIAPVLGEVKSVQQPKEAPGSPVYDAILDSIVKATGSDPSEFTPDTVIADLGVDSIMAIEIVSTVRDKTGVDLPAQFTFEYPTVGDLMREFGAALSVPEASETGYDSNSSTDKPSDIEKNATDPVSPESVSSLESGVLVEKEISATRSVEKTKPPPVEVVDDSPAPKARITLLQGRPGPNKTPFYMMADGTGSIATYIHLPVFKSGTPVYGVDSPFLRCPSRLTPEIGIEGVARLVVELLVKHHPKGNFIIGGFSAGSTVAYEVARQLPGVGRKVDGLLVIDLCCPRPDSGLLDESTVNRETDVGITIFGTAAAVDGLWTSTGSTAEHLRAYLFAMRNYHPPPMTVKQRPAAAAVIWAEKGMVNRVKNNPTAMKMLIDNGIPITAYPGYMEDPKNGPFACFIPDKTAADLGPNGWDKYVGDIMCLSMDADHLDMPMPGHVHLLHEQMTTVLAHFGSPS